MKLTRYLVTSSAVQERGHTLVELIVAMGTMLVIAAVISVSLRFQSDIYLTDVGRKRVQHNLRSALDIIAMNIRQAGEGLDAYFPAILLEQDTSPVTSILTLRRKLLHEVLLVCKPVGSGATAIFVSDDESTDAECLPVNIAGDLSAWTTQRTSNSGQIRIYLYDRVGHVGEYVDYSEEDSEHGDDYLTVSHVSRNYPARSTSLYVVEEYRFSLDTPNRTLQLTVDDDTDNPEDVAYNITTFTVGLRMQDDSTLTSLAPTDAQSWQDLRAVTITMTGEETWRTLTARRTLSAEYFPRNVLSR